MHSENEQQFENSTSMVCCIWQQSQMKQQSRRKKKRVCQFVEFQTDNINKNTLFI